jgi:hypothetical protein
LEQTEEFFVTGLKRYLDAKSAVGMFEQEVQRRVKNVLANHQPEFRELFGKDWTLRDHYESGIPDRMFLGQRVVFKGFGWVCFYFVFSRDANGDPRLSPSALFWRERASVLVELWSSVKAIQPRPQKLEILDDRFWLVGIRPDNDWSSCEKSLESVIIEWIELWKGLGGLPNYFAPQPPAM